MRLSTSRDPDADARIIENSFFRLTASAELGRVVSLVDKRDGGECLHGGIAFWAAEEIGGSALVSITEDSDLATLILSATDWERRLTWHAWVSLAPDVASISVRLSVYNRSFSPVECSPHIYVRAKRPVAMVPMHYAAQLNGDRLIGTAFERETWQLGPHQTATIEARLLSHLDVDRVDYSSEHAIAKVQDNQLIVSVAEKRSKLLLLVGSGGRTFETRVDLDPAKASVFPLDSLPAGLEVFQLRDERGEVLIDSRKVKENVLNLEIPTIPSLERAFRESQDSTLRSAERLPAVSSAAAFARGLLEMQRGNWEDAAALLEDAAILRGDDPLVWWAKNWCLRHIGEDNEHDLPNAHYLAPLEPVLRADAYLNAPEDAKPEALLDAWGNDPQPFLEVASLLYDAGLFEPRARWLEEARRRAPCRLIEMLLAAAHLDQGRDLAASEHVQFAGEVEDTVAPIRHSEVEAVGKVRAKFLLG